MMVDRIGAANRRVDLPDRHSGHPQGRNPRQNQRAVVAHRHRVADHQRRIGDAAVIDQREDRRRLVGPAQNVLDVNPQDVAWANQIAFGRLLPQQGKVDRHARTARLRRQRLRQLARRNGVGHDARAAAARGGGQQPGQQQPISLFGFAVHGKTPLSAFFLPVSNGRPGGSRFGATQSRRRAAGRLLGSGQIERLILHAARRVTVDRQRPGRFRRLQNPYDSQRSDPRGTIIQRHHQRLFAVERGPLAGTERRSGSFARPDRHVRLRTRQTPDEARTRAANGADEGAGLAAGTPTRCSTSADDSAGAFFATLGCCALANCRSSAGPTASAPLATGSTAIGSAARGVGRAAGRGGCTTAGAGRLIAGRLSASSAGGTMANVGCGRTARRAAPCERPAAAVEQRFF